MFSTGLRWVWVAVVVLCLVPIGHAHICSPPSLIPNKPRQTCMLACDTVPGHLVLNGTCTELCCTAINVLSKPCVQSLISWSGPQNITANQAQFASADLIDWGGQLLALSAVQDNQDLALNLVVKGFLKDFGKYSTCAAIDGAQYCYTSLKSKTFNTGPMSLGTVALCLPDTCGSADLQGLWSLILMGMNATDDFATETVCGDQSVAWDSGGIAMTAVSSVLALLVVAATAVEMNHKEAEELETEQVSADIAVGESSTAARTSVWWRVLECFSLFKNIEKFTQIRSGTPTSCLDGIRTLSMCWVVMGHVLLWPFDANLPGYDNLGDIVPYFNKDALIATFTGQVIMSAEFSVDSFFFMSGFLATYIGIKKLAGKSILLPLTAAPLMYLDRFLRLTPTYMFIVMMYTHVVPLLSSGPFWTTMDQEHCKTDWWQNLLYIQTWFIKTDDEDTCYGVSWYLADDMTFFYMVPFIFALAIWSRKVAYSTMTSMIVASVSYAFYIAYHYKLSPSPFDSTGLEYFPKYYYPPYMRVPPYLIGAILGIAWRDHQVQVSQALSRGDWAAKGAQFVLWAVAVGVLGSCMWGNSDQMGSVDSKLSQDVTRATTFVAFAKPAWSIGLSALCVLCFARVGGLVQWFLEAPIFGYLSKLTFTVYLLHPTVLFIWIRSQTAPLHFNSALYTANFLAILSFTSGLAFVVHLVVEQPTANLMGMLLGGGAGGKKKQLQPGDDPGDAKTPKAVDQDSVELAEQQLLGRGFSNWKLLLLPLPFQGESSYTPLSPSPAPNMLALAWSPVGMFSRNQVPELHQPLGGPDIENSSLAAQMA